jgi:cell wall-associated NlpC family hydrolase
MVSKEPLPQQIRHRLQDQKLSSEKSTKAAAGITLPRVAQDQFNAGPIVPSGQPLQQGDLVFFGASTTTVTHVGIVVSPTQMINAPDVGQLVRPYHIGDLVGATRPAALRSRH